MAAAAIRLNFLLLTAGGVIVLEAAAAMVGAVDAVPAMFVLFVCRLLEAGGVIWMARVLAGGASAVGLSRKTALTGLKRGLIWSAGFGAIVLLAWGLGSLFDVNLLRMVRSPLPRETADRIWYILAGGLASPLAEELVFRGVVYGFFRRWGIAAALILSNMFYVPLHGLSGVPATQIVGGLLFAVSYEIEGNLMVPVVIHILGNMSIFILSLYLLM